MMTKKNLSNEQMKNEKHNNSKNPQDDQKLIDDYIKRITDENSTLEDWKHILQEMQTSDKEHISFFGRSWGLLTHKIQYLFLRNNTLLEKQKSYDEQIKNLQNLIDKLQIVVEHSDKTISLIQDGYINNHQIRKEIITLNDNISKDNKYFQDHIQKQQIDQEQHNIKKTIDIMSSAIDIIDNIDSIYSVLKEQNKSEHKNIIKALEVTRDRALNLLQKNKIISMNVIATNDFNPNIHDAVGIHQDNTLTDNTIYKVIKQGYYFNNEIMIRPAVVIVVKNS